MGADFLAGAWNVSQEYLSQRRWPALFHAYLPTFTVSELLRRPLAGEVPCASYSGAVLHQLARFTEQSLGY